jgi:hypothetical protein
MTRLLDEIADWKLEAKSESTARYFFHVKETNDIVRGQTAYVIGRKGTGKTAIAEYVMHLFRFDTFTEKLTFKNFPFNELYGLKNNAYTPPNEYITFWKYLIYAFVCKMMARNEAVDPETRVVLEKVFAPPSVRALEKWISRWTANDFSLNVMGTGGKLGIKEVGPSPQSWTERVDILEDLILNCGGPVTYYVVFDELDEDYKNMIDKQHYTQYTDLLTGLFKAVQDVKSRFKGSPTRLLPIVFLRDDIYDVLMDSDKPKWDDFKIDLEWGREQIKRLLAFRITRAENEYENNPLSFENAWAHTFQGHSISVGHEDRRQISAFEYVTRSTLLRPRDFIKYLQTCAEETPKEYHRISSNTVKRVSKSFSNYLKRELVAEIHGVIPEINAALSVISQIRKQTFSIEEFTREYDKQVQRGAIKDKDVNFVLNVLFNFSVLGNQPSQKTVTVFRYLNKDAQLNFREKIVVHSGLFKALQII